MANKQISNLPLKSSVVATDQFGVDDAVGTSWKVTALLILNYIQANITIAESQVTNLTSDLAARLIAANNLSDVANAATALSHLGGLPLAGGTMTGDLIAFNATPPTNLSYACKQYVDNVASGLNPLPSCKVATTANLTATYNNGTSGVGATLTNSGVQAALAIDGITLALNDRVLVKNQSTPAQNGIYYASNLGSGVTNWVLTRATDYDTPTEINPGDLVVIEAGNTNGVTSWLQTATVTNVGTDAINFSQFTINTSTLIVNIQNNGYVYAADTGSANAYAAALSPALTAYTAGLEVKILIANTNTGVSTLNINSLGTKNIVLADGTALVGNEIVSGMIAKFMYDGTNMQLINPANKLSNRNYQNNVPKYANDGGSANTYTATLTPALTAYVAGNEVILKIANSNTGTSTLNVNGLGAKNITLISGAPLAGGEIISGMAAKFVYDGTNYQLINPAILQGYGKNMLIGCDFSTNPWQRGVTFNSTANATYLADMWQWIQTGAGVVNCLQGSDAPTEAQAGIFTQNCIEVDTSTAAAVINAGDYYALEYRMEGYDYLKISQRSFTVSFWVKSHKTGIFCVGFRNTGGDRSYVHEYTINNADTWEKKSFTVSASPIAGTWNYLNAVGLIIDFPLACGSTFGSGTNNTWTSNNMFATSNQVNGMDSNTNIFKIALVQLEVGSVANLYEPHLRSEILLRCQRYYRKSYTQGVNPGTSSALGSITYVTAGTAYGAATNLNTVTFPPMRTAPTVTIYSITGATGNIRNTSASSDLAATAANIGDAAFSTQVSASMAANNQYAWHYTANASL